MHGNSAGGALFPEAVRELAALPQDAPTRALAEPILLRLQHQLEQRSNLQPDEQEFLMVMHRSWEDARVEGRIEGRVEGRIEGRIENQAQAVLTVLGVRKIPVSDDVRQRILAQHDLAQLTRWLERAVTATTIDDVFDDRR